MPEGSQFNYLSKLAALKERAGAKLENYSQKAVEKIKGLRQKVKGMVSEVKNKALSKFMLEGVAEKAQQQKHLFSSEQSISEHIKLIKDVAELPELIPSQAHVISDLDGVWIETPGQHFQGKVEEFYNQAQLKLKSSIEELRSKITPNSTQKLNQSNQEKPKSNFNTRFKALRDTLQASKPKAITFFSSRITEADQEKFYKDKPLPDYALNARNISSFPFFAGNSANALENFVRKVSSRDNPNIEVDMKISITKTLDSVTSHLPFSQSKTQEGSENEQTTINEQIQRQAIDLLKSGETVVVLGSSIFDRKLIKKIIKQASEENLNLDKFYYYDTGQLVI